MGRPAKITPELFNNFIEALKLGMSRNRACMLCGISGASMSVYLSKNPNKANEVKKAEATTEAFNLAIIRKAAKDKTWTAAAWLLERKWPERWALKDRERKRDSGDREMRELIEKANATLAKISGSDGTDSGAG